MKELYTTSDIFIFPSKEEGWGLTPLEAMKCGSVVVGTSTGFVLDLGVDKKNMMISKINDINMMVNNIIYLMENIEEYNIIRKNGYELANSLKWEKSFEKFQNILKNDIERN